MTIAVSAGNDCWRYYKSGILSRANNCPTRIDHGVVVVGVHHAGGDGGNDDADDDDEDDDVVQRRYCRKAERAEKRAKQCLDAPEAMLEPNNAGKPNRKCCIYRPNDA